MKINILLIFIIFFSAKTLAQKQIVSGNINYDIEFRFDENKIRKKLKVMKGSEAIKEKLVIDLYKTNTKLNFLLQFNNEAAVFKKIKKLNKKMGMINFLVDKGLYYTHKKTKTILIQKEAFGQQFLVNTPTLNWQLTQESKIIGKYVCFKATTEKLIESSKGVVKQKITAWYATAIPINFGPQDYFGLPGLILELNVGQLFYKAYNIKLSFKRNIKISKPTKGKKVSLKEFDAIGKKITKNASYN